MTPTLSPNTQAILLLTAPLLVGKGSSFSTELLSPSEYKRLARHLWEMQRQPADLTSPDAAELLRACQPIIDAARLQRLLGRGFLLSQVIEHWQARAIWVLSRADAEYPRRLKIRLREDTPAVIYGCGDMSLLDAGGLAVVGSRHVDESLIDYAMAVGRLTARANKITVSGGAKGIDQAAMRGALEAGGCVCGVLADSLEKTAMNREHRNLLLDGQLVLISPYDPKAGFNVGHAMQRNKLIYALTDAALIVSSDLKKGGTWNGAVEQLDKLKLGPVYVRSTGELTPGIEALLSKGAMPWPNPQDVDTFAGIFDAAMQTRPIPPPAEPMLPLVSAPLEPPAAQPIPPVPSSTTHSNEVSLTTDKAVTPADKLYAAVKEAIQLLLNTPMKDAEVANALAVSKAQAKTWLQRLVDEGVIQKQKSSAGYTLKQSGLFG